MNGTPDTSPDARPSLAPQDWMVTDLQDETRQLQDRLAAASQQISEQIAQLSGWADSLPARHVRDHDPVRVADLALNDLPSPLSLARRIRQLGALLDQAATLSSTLRATAIAEHGLFGPTGTSVNDDLPPAEPGSDPGPDGPASPADVVDVVAYCHSAWNDDDVFERQRQTIRKALEFDGVRAWHGTLPADIGQELPRWEAVITAAQAGASVQLRLSP